MRIMISKLWICANIGLGISAIAGSFTELRSVNSAMRLVDITDPILVHGISKKHLGKGKLFGVTDLSILLMLARRNFSSNNKVFKMCMQAEKIMNLMDKEASSSFVEEKPS